MDHFQTLLQPAQVIAGGYQLKTTYFLGHQPPQGVAASRGGLKIAISKSPVYETLVVREDVPVWVKALTPKAEIDLEKMTFGSVPVDATLAVEGLSPDGATMFVVTAAL